MRLKNIDWTSDVVVLILVFIAVLLIVSVLLERASPKRKRGIGRGRPSGKTGPRKPSNDLIY